MEKYSFWAMSFPLARGGDGNVMQGHADYCAKWGHATDTRDGVVMSWCPRCGGQAVCDHGHTKIEKCPEAPCWVA